MNRFSVCKRQDELSAGSPFEKEKFYEEEALNGGTHLEGAMVSTIGISRWQGTP
jgi:hypothetical protein